MRHPANAKEHALNRYHLRFRTHLSPRDYRQTCRDIRRNTIAAWYMQPAKEGREEWVVYAGERWVRAIWDSDCERIVTFKHLTDGARAMLRERFG